MQRVIVIFGLLLSACTGHEPTERLDERADALHLMSVQPEEPVPGEPPPDEKLDTEQPTPYAGWSTWCEPTEYDTVCKTDNDCSGIEVEAIGRPLRCVKPWWAKSNELKVCAPGYSGRSERSWRHARLREVVRLQYFDETEHCVLDDRPIHKEHWRCQREWKQAETLTSFLWLVYKRETTGRPYKRHRLNPDLDANRQAWVRRASDYGWKMELVCASGRKRCKNASKLVHSFEPARPDHNAHYGERYRWQYGLGGLGQNTALWTDTWDPMAPPEILCREVPAFETYLRRARNVISMLANGVDCDGDGKKDHVDSNPTWVVVHRATSGGKICPSKWPNNKHEENFRRRAKREGLDPDQVVTLDMLGHPIPKDSQNEIMAQIHQTLDEKLPNPMRN